MQHNRIIWGVIALLVLVTLSISFVPSSTHSQQANPQQDMSKYPVVDFDAPEPSESAEKEKKNEKDKRYDKKPFIVHKPLPDYTGSTLYDYESMPSSAFPYDQSKLVISGVITGSKALLSAKKSSVYSEYNIQIESILKQSGGRELQIGQVVSADRIGGRVKYPNGAVMLYRVDWQDLPEPNERYLFFLDSDEEKNPNYKIVTAYKMKDEIISPLDAGTKFREHNGRKKAEFIKLAKDAAKEQ